MGRPFPRWFVAVVCLGASVRASAVQGGTLVTLPVTNPGAETGDLTGWTDPGAVWRASNAVTAPEGTWYFETSQSSDSPPAYIYQLIDVRPYTGRIRDVEFSVSISVDDGHASYDNGHGLHDWVWSAAPTLILYDASMQFLAGAGPLVQGTPSTNWTSQTMALGQIYSESQLVEVAFIHVELTAFWWDLLADELFDLPPTAITDPPQFTRFDTIQVSLSLPEPGTCACGDMDGSGRVDVRDFKQFAKCLGTHNPITDCPASTFACADLGSNGSIDLRDFSRFTLYFGAPPRCSPPGGLEYGIKYEQSTPYAFIGTRNGRELAAVSFDPSTEMED